jgi:hypothetical protein
VDIAGFSGRDFRAHRARRKAMGKLNGWFFATAKNSHPFAILKCATRRRSLNRAEKASALTEIEPSKSRWMGRNGGRCDKLLHRSSIKVPFL